MKYVLRVMMEYQVVLKGAENKQVRVSRIRVSKQLTFLKFIITPLSIPDSKFDTCTVWYSWSFFSTTWRTSQWPSSIWLFYKWLYCLLSRKDTWISIHSIPIYWVLYMAYKLWYNMTDESYRKVYQMRTKV